MSIDNLRRRIDRALAAVEQLYPAPRERFTFRFAMHLFTPAEQDTLQAFLDQVEPLYRYDQDNQLSLSELTEEQFDRLGLWIYLEAALQQENLEDAAKYRRRLAMSLEQLIAAFLAIDLSFLPTGVNAPGIPIQEERCIYHLNRVNYRNTVINHIERGRVTRDTIDDMRRWVDYVESRQIAA